MQNLPATPSGTTTTHLESTPLLVTFQQSRVMPRSQSGKDRMAQWRSAISGDCRPEMVNPIAAEFEAGYLAVPLDRQVEQCGEHELAPLFEELFPTHQPILEAGAGSGRWVVWFSQHGWAATGLDWSVSLVENARAHAPSARFEVGDMRAMPFHDGEFGAVVALGSIEHDPAGPTPVLQEFHRVLRPDGIAIITVPWGGPLAKLSKRLRRPFQRIKELPSVRRLFGKQPRGKRTLAEAKKETRRGWFPAFNNGQEGWFFYQYWFSRRQARRFLLDTGFSVVREYRAGADEGVLHNFGHLAATFDYANGRVVFTPLGRFLRKVLPIELVGFHLVYVVRRLAPTAAA